MNPYKNLLTKVKALLKEDDHLTKAQCEQMQWQLLVKIADYQFVIGKGGVNTIFYTASSEERAICYPDEAIALLEKLAKGEVFTYIAVDKNKEVIGNALTVESAQAMKNARTVFSINFKGRRTVVSRKVVDLFNKKVWQSSEVKKKRTN